RQELDPLDKEIIKLINAHPGIRWIDFQKDVRPFLAISDVFVFPSYREGFPNVVMQAGAMNLPCIVSDINGCNEIIEENINGVIIPIKNVQALQQAMNSLFVDHKTCKAMASVSRQLIVRRFESNALIEEILKEYHLQIAKQTMV
ncbi:glycosyltransferase, partial [Pedobacter sp. ASV28]|uniref:glycosyltransferase n=1 Tax=Pedobacter sp. ASV28 TaxID=2795123 RepID=UPI0018EC3B93